MQSIFNTFLNFFLVYSYSIIFTLRCVIGLVGVLAGVGEGMQWGLRYFTHICHLDMDLPLGFEKWTRTYTTTFSV